MLQLWDFQAEGVDAIRKAFMDGYRSPLYVLPTGGGKTVVFSDIAGKTVQKKKKALILVHRIELLRQTSDALNLSGIDHGMINPKYRMNMMMDVQVASVHTLVNKMARLPFDPNLIIIDEAHHATAETWRQICRHYSNALLLGVTATPIRTDGAGLGISAGGFFDHMIVGPQIHELIAKGRLVPPEVYTPLQLLDMSDIDVDHSTNDFNKKQLANKIDKPTIIGNAIEEYKKLCPGEPAVMFCVSVKHAENVAAQFRAAGFRFYSIDGDMDDDQRRAMIQALGTGEIQGLCSCDLISEGTNIPAVSCVGLLRPTLSLSLFLQQVGRGLRIAPGKTKCIILDLAGNVIRHGMPEDHREWDLDGEKKQKRSRKKNSKPRMKRCSSCELMHAPSPECPRCGHVYGLLGESIIQINGELTQVTDDVAETIKKARIKEVAAAHTLEDLQRIAVQRGYNKSWPMHILQARQKKTESENQ